jgi:diguanylate cyclase (GGDEF)-like protein
MLHQPAFRIVVIYALVAALWILVSDSLADLLFRDSTYVQTGKGWFFVAVTAWLLYRLIVRETQKLSVSERLLQEKNEALTATNEELMAAEEELRSQFDELSRSQEQSRRQNECLLALRETAFALIGERDVDDLLRYIVETAAELGDCQHAYLYLLTDDGKEMELKIRTGMCIQETGFRQRKDEGVVGQVWQTGEPLIVADYPEWAGHLADPRFGVIKTSTGFPLKAGGQVVGVFGLNYTEKHELDEALLDLVGSFGELASIALQNASLHSRLTFSQAQMKAVIDAIPDAILRLNREGVLLDYKLGSEIETIYDFSDKIGRLLADFAPPDIAQDIIGCVARAVETRQIQHYEYVLDDGAGRRRHREVRVVVCGDSEAIAIVRDTTRQKEMADELRRLSMVDQATGIYNRAYFEETLRRMNDDRYLPVGVIVGDIDGLKFINETFGHLTGDSLVTVATGIISSCFGPGDIVARIDGGEFAVIMPNSSADAVEQAARAIREETGRYREKSQMPLAISVGFSVRTCAGDKMKDTFTAADKNMHREKLHSQQSGHSAIVSTLAKALEARDFVTDGHADRLQEQMERLAIAAGLPATSLPDLRLLGRFHDIGKVGIPDSILFKPGRLTDEEYQIMKRHCEIGYRIALASPELAPIADWILRHQEWWNGGGYPLGLAGEDIPLPCRILAIVDAYDAMTNDRPYRKAMSQDDALAELVRCADRQFDPALVELFIKIIKPSSGQ